MAIERMTAQLPAGFDPAKHGKALVAMVVSKHGDGWELESIDPATKTATLTRQVALVEVTELTSATKSTSTYARKQVNLPRNTKPSDGDKIAARFEDQHPGFFLSRFEPWVGRAELTALPESVALFRFAVASALGVKPWEIRDPLRRKDGGFTATLPVWQPSKHEQKLEEATISIVGKPGWWFTVNPATRQLDMNPGDLPTFPAAYRFPFDNLPGGLFDLPAGVALGGSGVDNFPLMMDLNDNAGILAQGLAGSGKSVWINAIVASALFRGWQICVLDVRQKLADFLWCRDLVRENGWGCDSKTEAVAALRLVYEEGVRRGDVLTEHRVQKWQDLPEKVRKQYPPILIVIDEAQGLFASDPISKALPKDHPIRLEQEQAALESDLLKAYTSKLPAEMRAAGLRMLLVSQQTSANTGIPPTMKINLPNKVLLGPNATKQARSHALANPDATPEVPDYIRSDDKAAKGTGVAELEGRAPAVIKGYYASTDDYRAFLLAHGVPQTNSPNPTAQQIARLVPRVDDAMDFPDDGPPNSALDAGGFGQQDGRDIAAGDRLKGAAAASHQMAVDAAMARKRQAAESDDF